MVKFLIGSHNRYYLLIFNVNKLYKWKLLLYYYVAIPILSVFIITIINSEHQLFLLRAIFAVMFMVTVIIVFLSNYFVSSVSTSIHSNYKIIHSLIARKSDKFNISLHFKLQNSLIRLSGSKIGFTCGDLFTFTAFESFYFPIYIFGFYTLVYGLIY
jgi:hypothetical protein